MVSPQKLWHWGEGESTTLRVAGFLATARPARAYLRPICMMLMFRPHCDTSSIVPYDDPSLALTGRVVEEIFSWNTSDRLGRELKLYDGKYFCPNCDDYCLGFEVIAVFS